MANFNLSYASGKLAYVDPSGNAVSVITPAWIAPEYSKKTYAKNELTMHEGKLYYAKSAIGTAENWTASHWQETTLAGVLNNKADKT